MNLGPFTHTTRPASARRSGALAGTAALLLLTFGANACGTADPKAAAPAPTESATATATAAPANGDTSAAGTGGAGAPPSGGSSTNTPSVQIGNLFYGPARKPVGENGNLRSWRPGENPVRLMVLPHTAATLNVNVSPDGRRVAWAGEGADDSGNLYIANVDGSNKQKMRSEVDPYCVTPAWSPDGRQLLFRVDLPGGGHGRFGLLDTRSEKRTVRWWRTEPSACHAVWSADGKTIAMTTDVGVTVDAGVVLYGTDGTKKRAIPGFSLDGWHSNDIASLSPDGSRIALLRMKLGEDDGNLARDLRANVVLDTRTGKQVSLPLGGRTLHQVYFQSDGSMVVRVQSGSRYAVLLVDEDGRKVSETAEPASLKDEQILAVVD
ncbi:hypothetical protein OG598_26935 [Micromonospora sp. NBC_00330]|uniref:TolB family protein n=1 Tax=Micromonospora sp. NBC_00330 TaxID=2903585 RepID=UPI002E29669F|nr:hypothetical protein [Micromonospora sp. NBC_00330]